MNNFSLNNFIFVLFKNNKNYYLKHLKTKKNFHQFAFSDSEPLWPSAFGQLAGGAFLRLDSLGT